MITCPNKNLKEWVDLEAIHGDTAYSIWNAFNGEVPEKYYNFSVAQKSINSIFKGKEAIILEEALNAIIDKEHTLKDLALKLKDLVANDLGSITVKLKDIPTEWYPVDRVIVISRNNPNPKGIESSILHETLHFLIDQNFYDEKNKENVDKLNRLYSKVRNLYPNEYNTQNIDEFITGIFTNSQFISLIKTIPAIDIKYNNIWEEIWNNFLDIFKVKDGSLYEQAFAVASEILENKAQPLNLNTNGTEFIDYTNKFIQNNSVESNLKSDIEVINQNELTLENIIDIEIPQVLNQLENSQTIPQSNEEIVSSLKEVLKDKYPEFRLETIDKLGVNGLVNFKDNIVQIKKGKETAISEEAAHVIISLHPRKNDFLELASESILFGKVFEEYKSNSNYWKDGKVNLELIKEETAGKLLAEAMYATNTNDWTRFNEWVSERRKKDFIGRLKQLLKEALRFIKGLDIKLFSDTAEGILRNEVDRVESTTNQSIMLQLNSALEQSTFDTLEKLHNQEDYDNNKGKALLDMIQSGRNILRDNIKLTTTEYYKGKIVLPTETAKHISRLLEKETVVHNDLEEVSKAFLVTMEGVRRFTKFSQKVLRDIRDTDIDTASKIQRFASQWSYYIQELENSKLIEEEGELYNFIKEIKEDIAELDNIVFNNYKAITTKILTEQIQPIVNPIKNKAINDLIAKNPIWQDTALISFLTKEGFQKWNKIALNPKESSVFENKIASIGKLEVTDIRSKSVMDLLATIISNTFDEHRILDIITGKEGDSQSIANLFYGSSTNRDAIISVFQKIIDTSVVKSSIIAKEIVEEYMNRVAKLAKIANISSVEIGKKITTVSKRLVNNKEEETLVYLTDVKQEAYLIADKLKKERDDLGRNTEEWKVKNKEYKDWMLNNFHQQYIDDFYLKLNDTSDIAIEAKKETEIIWSNIGSLQEQLESLPYIVNNKYNPERQEKEDAIEKEYINYKRLYSKYENGKLKNQLGQDIAEYLTTKAANLNLYEYEEIPNKFELEVNRFFDEYLSIVANNESLDNNIELIKEQLNSPNRNLKAILKYVDKIESKFPNSETKKWFSNNIKRVYTQDFYESRKNITDQIQAILQNDKSNKWEDIFGTVKPYKDIDGVIDGTLLNDLELKQIRDFEQSLIDNKKSSSLNKDERDELTRLIQELEDLQQRIPTDYYNQKYFDLGSKVSGKEFLETLKTRGEDEADIRQLATEVGISDIDEFMKWFEQNHIQKAKYSMGEEYFEWHPIYAWVEIKPNDDKFIDYQLGKQYNKKVVKQEYFNDESNKDEFGRWKPKFNKLDGTSTGFRNDAYFNLENSTNKEDRALFGILQELKNQHIEAQYSDGRFLNNNLLFFVIPQKHKETFEDPSQSAKILKNKITGTNQDTQDANFQSENVDETIGEVASNLGRKGLLAIYFDKAGGWFSKYFKSYDTSISTDYQGERIFKAELSLHNHVPLTELSTDILFTQAEFIESSKIHQAFNDLNPKITIIQKTLKKFRTGKNRLQAIENTIDREVQGIYKLYEAGKGVDKILSTLKWIGSIRSQSILNFKGAIKNSLAGTGNLWINKDLLSDGSLYKAERTFMSKWHSLKSQLLTNKPKDKDFKLFEFFNPKLTGNFKYYMNDKSAQVFKNGSWAFSLQEEGEFQLLGVTLELFLESNYKDGKLKDFLIVETNDKGIQQVKLTNGTEQELYDLKLRFAEIMRIIQGNQGLQKAKTETGRYSIWSAVMHYRNYLPYTLINRFSTKRTNFYTESEMEGYYNSTAKSLYYLAKDLKNAKANWATLNDLEKENMLKTTKELSVILGAMTLLMLLGYSDGDKDRFKKMKDNNYFHNLLLYETIASYNEIVGLSPLRFTGFFKEATGNITKTSMVFGEIGKYISLVEDLGFLLTGDRRAYVEKNTAFSKKGDNKFIEDLQKLIGYNNLTGSFSNEQLAEQTKNYILQLERN